MRENKKGKKVMKSGKIMNLRVLAVFLVMIGHSIILYDPSWGVINTTQSSQFLYYLKQWINLIQMPLFFSISGYLFYNTMQKQKYKAIIELVKDKAVRLLIPFIFFGIGCLLPIRFFIQYHNYQFSQILNYCIEILIGKDTGYLWFLPTLFFIFIFVYILEKYNKKLKKSWIWILLLIISVLARKLPSIFFIRLIATYLVWFYLGFLMNPFLKKNIKIKREKYIIGMVSLVLISILYVIVSDKIRFRLLY